MESLMERNVVKQVRLTGPEAKRLRALARDLKCTESDVLRRGLEGQYEKRELADRRRKGFDELIRMAKEVPGEPKFSWSMKG